MRSFPARQRGWLLILFAVVSTPVMAQDAWRCRAADGALSFQDHPCAPGAQQREIVFAPAPAPAPSPDYLLPAAPAGVRLVPARTARESAPRSFECRAANGEVFYRHGACPASIADATHRAAGGSRRSGPASVRVTAVPLARREACRRMHASGAGARAGRARDEDVSTYERNLGRDPCR